MRRPIRSSPFKSQAQGLFDSLHSVNIHYPPTTYMDDSTRKSVIADLPGLRLAKHITLVRSAQQQPSSNVFGPHTNRLNLRLHNKVPLASTKCSLTRRISDCHHAHYRAKALTFISPDMCATTLPKGTIYCRLQMDSGSRSREVVVSCPYWVVNKTNLILRLKDTTLNANQPIAAPPGLGGQAEPVLFRQVTNLLGLLASHFYTCL